MEGGRDKFPYLCNSALMRVWVCMDKMCFTDGLSNLFNICCVGLFLEHLVEVAHERLFEAGLR